MALDNKKKKQLKAKAHHLKPVVRIGQHGLTPNVIKETDGCLQIHELIKVHIHEGKREERHAIAIELAKATRAEFVYQIGKVFILYREKQDET